VGSASRLFEEANRDRYSENFEIAWGSGGKADALANYITGASSR
jgi:hypothetical protein